MSQQRMDFRGGAREGAGRKAIGTSKQISLTLPQDTWEWIDKCVEEGQAASRSELLRKIIHERKEGSG